MLSPLAIAQNNQQQNVNESIKAATQTASTGTNASYDAQSQIKSGGYDFFSKQALAIATSIVGANIIAQCFTGLKVPSIATYIAGSLTHIVSELAGAKAQNDNHNKRLEELKALREAMIREAKEGGQIQREALVRAKLEEEQTRDFFESRIKWMLAVSAIYYAAMGLALMEESSGHALGLALATAECQAFLPLPMGGPPAVAACIALSPAGAASTLPNFANPGAVGVALGVCGAEAVYAPMCSSYLLEYLAVGYGSCLPFSPASGLKGMLMAKAVVAAYSFGMVKTGDSNVTTYTVMLSNLLLLLVPSLQTIVMAAYNFPIPRSITFGASGVLATTILAGLMERKKVAEENIVNLEKVLKDFREKTDDPNGIGLGPSVAAAAPNEANVLKPIDKKYDISKLAPVNPAGIKTCLSDQGEKFIYSSQGCSKPVKVAKPVFNIKDGVKLLNDVGSMANDLANATSSGEMEKANLLAEQIGSQAASIKEVTKALQDRLNKQLKASGKKEIDFDKEIKNKLDSMDSNFNQIAASKGYGPTSATSESQTSSALVTNVKEDVSEKVNSNTVAAISQLKPQEVDFGASSSNLGTEEVKEEAPKKVASLDESLEQYEPNQSDISKNSDVSIFKQVSNRYFLNYDKIFQRKQIAPPLATEDK